MHIIAATNIIYCYTWKNEKVWSDEKLFEKQTSILVCNSKTWQKSLKGMIKRSTFRWKWHRALIRHSQLDPLKPLEHRTDFP